MLLVASMCSGCVDKLCDVDSGAATIQEMKDGKRRIIELNNHEYKYVVEREKEDVDSMLLISLDIFFFNRELQGSEFGIVFLLLLGSHIKQHTNSESALMLTVTVIDRYGCSQG